MYFWNSNRLDFIKKDKKFQVLYFDMSSENDLTLKEILSNDRFFGSSDCERQMAGLILKYRGHSVDKLRCLYNS